MPQFRIQLRSVQDVREFIALATTMPFNVFIEDGTHRVKGCSFMEMFCLDLAHPLNVCAECGEKEFEAFRQAVQRFII